MLGHHCGVLVFCYTEINFQRMWGKAVIRLIQDVIQNLVSKLTKSPQFISLIGKLIYWRLKNMNVI
ncbi:hypothetical protein HMPREF1885_01459 [Streptococcus agalactiae]|nr:hypothetical protein HMPREF1885_01459 [Streptococcus agalactiae]